MFIILMTSLYNIDDIDDDITLNETLPEAQRTLDRFSAPLPMGSGAGLQWSKKRGIFLSSLPQLKIGFGWGSMALNWITAHLRKPHALSNLWVTHSLLS
jgi:hypothetical protein